MQVHKTELRDGMTVDWDVPIEMNDGTVLRADVYRPDDGQSHPALLSYGPYAKWLHFGDGASYQWKRLCEDHPDAVARSSNLWQSWEVVDPEKWVPDGYACVRIDSRGAGRSPGYLEIWSPRETGDLYHCIEWTAAQDWCDGKVGINGVSYYAINQWQVASLQPPSLAAICVWEGAADLYRDLAYHGGILCTFADIWYRGRVLPKQHGLGRRGYRSRINGDWVSGPETLTDEELEAGRSDFGTDLGNHPLVDEYWRARQPDFSKIDVPLLSAGNWGGAALHLRGNVEGFLHAATDQKWLEIHGLEHWTHFYTDYGVALQKRFFGHFLRGDDTGWQRQPRVLLQVRHPGEVFEERHEEEWPLARTQWTKFFMNPNDMGLEPSPLVSQSSVSYEALGDGVTFLTPPLAEQTEITGPLSAKIFISSETEDADVFVVLRLFTPDLAEVTFRGANEPHSPIAHGWLRASHRRLDPELSLPHRPYHVHEAVEPLTPGEVYELDVEIWPTSIVIPEGYRLGLSVRGRDYVYPGSDPAPIPVAGPGATAAVAFTGVGPFRHNDASNRPPEMFDGRVTLYASADWQSHVLLPVVPARLEGDSSQER